MARNFKEPQARMAPASRADNTLRVNEELQRMALDELRGARQLTQTDLAEMLDVPQSSISRIEQRADMYLSTLRNYIHAVGGELRVQAIFPDGATVVIDRFGEYEEQIGRAHVMEDGGGRFRLGAHPINYPGVSFSTRPFRISGLTKTMRALHLPEVQIANIKEQLENKGGPIEIGGSGSLIQRVFSIPELVAAGFEETNTE